MGTQGVYRELSKKLLMENSEILPEIWRVLCDEDEAALINAMPASAEALAGRFGLPVEAAREKLDALFKRGVVFEQVKDGVVQYRMPRHVVQFHDATLLWEDAPEKMTELWVRF
ncbi:MAG TPA: 4Fe-4S ferredoxin, partial [Spirochaetes bacterium]|nr:4Fe-4S ferredoxin [Spirochaetota bacterium]